MKYLLFFLALTIAAGAAVADTDLEVRVNRIEMAVTAPDDSDAESDTADATDKSAATDHNSSRSNKTSSVAAPEPATSHNASRSNRSLAVDPDSDNDSVSNDVCPDGVDNDCDDPNAEVAQASK
jgi:hypothetical protein